MSDSLRPRQPSRDRSIFLVETRFLTNQRAYFLGLFSKLQFQLTYDGVQSMTIPPLQK